MEQPNHKKRRNQSFFNSITETTLDQLNLWWGKETTEPRVEQARNQNAQWMNRKNQRNERSTAKEIRKTIGANKHHRRVDCGQRIAGVGGSAGAEASAVWGVIGEREGERVRVFAVKRGPLVGFLLSDFTGKVLDPSHVTGSGTYFDPPIFSPGTLYVFMFFKMYITLFFLYKIKYIFYIWIIIHLKELQLVYIYTRQLLSNHQLIKYVYRNFTN